MKYILSTTLANNNSDIGCFVGTDGGCIVECTHQLRIICICTQFPLADDLHFIASTYASGRRCCSINDARRDGNQIDFVIGSTLNFAICFVVYFNPRLHSILVS